MILTEACKGERENTHMKKYVMTALFGILLTAAAGCGGTQAQDETAEEETAENETAEEKTEEEAVGSLSSEAKSAYHSVLYDVYFNHLFPDGKDYGFLEGADVSENEFAVYDVDRDGSQELLISYTTTEEAVEVVYDFISAFDAVREEFVEYPGTAFYDNGYVQAVWSGNRGLSGESFQPYTLYQYDAESDAYTAAAQVDAWERSVSETDSEGNSFPDDVDVSGTGMVYYITPEGDKTGEPVDQAEYEEWEASWRGDAEELAVPWMKLTEENMDIKKK